MSIQNSYVCICLPYNRRIRHSYHPKPLLLYYIFCWTLHLLASLSSPAQSTANISETAAIEALLFLRCLDLASKISVLRLLLLLVPMWTRTPGSSLVHFTSQPRLLGRSVTFAALPSLLPAAGHICLPKSEWDLSSAVALHVVSLPSPDLWEPELYTKVQNTGLTVMVTDQKICSARSKKFSNVLLFPQPAWRPHELSPLPTEPPVFLTTQLVPFKKDTDVQAMPDAGYWVL